MRAALPIFAVAVAALLIAATPNGSVMSYNGDAGRWEPAVLPAPGAASHPLCGFGYVLKNDDAGYRCVNDISGSAGVAATAYDLNCTTCVADGEIDTVAGSKVSGDVASAGTANLAYDLSCTTCVTDGAIDGMSMSKLSCGTACSAGEYLTCQDTGDPTCTSLPGGTTAEIVVVCGTGLSRTLVFTNGRLTSGGTCE